MAHIEKHPSLPIIIRHYDQLNISQVEARVVEETLAILNAQPEKVYYLIDASQIQLGLEDLTKAGGMAASKDSTINHEKIIETLVVVSNRLSEIAAQGLRTAAFGHLKIRPFRTMDEALAYVTQQLEEKHGS